MDWEIVNSSCWRQVGGTVVRLSPGPLFAQHPNTGAWTPIGPHADFPGVAPLVTIAPHSATGMWIVSLGSASVAIMAMNSDYAAARLSAPRIANAFGNIIDPTKISGNTLTFQVTAGSSGLDPVPTQDAAGHWHFGGIDGVDLGVFWHKWLAMFGSRCVINGGTITIDITVAKAAGKPVNMDPSVVLGAYCRYYLIQAPDWETGRTAGQSDFAWTGYDIKATAGQDQGISFDRTAIRFDTSAYPSVTAAKLVADVAYDQSYGPLASGVIANCCPGGNSAFVDGEGNDAIAEALATGYAVCLAGTTIGLFGDVNSPNPTLDVTAAYASTTQFDLAWLHPYDVNDDSTDALGGMNMLDWWTIPPFHLELTMGSPSGGGGDGSGGGETVIAGLLIA